MAAVKTEHEHDDQQRIAIVEQNVKSLFQGIEQLAKGVESLRSDVSDVVSRLGTVGKTSWPQVFTLGGSIIGTIIILGGGLWSIAIKPTQDKAIVQDEKLSALEKGSVTQVEQAREVETQFEMFSKLSNERTLGTERLLDILWYDQYGRYLPPRSYWPEVGKHREK